MRNGRCQPRQKHKTLSEKQTKARVEGIAQEGQKNTEGHIRVKN
jgi:hypothetical protein